MLSLATQYAATAIGYLSRHGGGPILVRVIAADCDLPGPYLAKVINLLSQAGLLATRRGVRGGVRLIESEEPLTLRTICEATGDPILKDRCFLRPRACDETYPCPGHEFTVAFRSMLDRCLSELTATDLERLTDGLPGERGEGAGQANSGMHNSDTPT